MSAIAWRWLGRRRYGPVLEEQRALREAVIRGEAPETLLLLEHEPVVTVGRRAAAGTPAPELLAAQGVDFFAVERGGLATWHGPGQLVAYAIVQAERRGLGVKGLSAALLDGVTRWLALRGVPAGPRPGYPGVWVSGDKICAIGLHFRQGVSMHGVALNLRRPAPGSFDLIVPCGITDAGVTSLEALGQVLEPAEAAPSVAAALVAAVEAASGSGPSRLTGGGPAD